jgi:transcriptional regulator with XRE-family HTH domain
MPEQYHTLGEVIARNVKAERARKGWKQDTLAARLGMSRASLSHLESGSLKVTANHLPPLCEALGIPLSDLIRGADPDDIKRLGMP